MRYLTCSSNVQRMMGGPMYGLGIRRKSQGRRRAVNDRLLSTTSAIVISRPQTIYRKVEKPFDVWGTNYIITKGITRTKLRGSSIGTRPPENNASRSSHEILSIIGVAQIESAFHLHLIITLQARYSMENRSLVPSTLAATGESLGISTRYNYDDL